MVKSNSEKTHLHCVHQDIHKQLAIIESHCLENKIRLTPLRKEVLSIILDNKSALGAYEIMKLLQKTRSKPTAPPTVYRALDFLMEHGFIHRLTSINAFIPCCHPRDNHQAAFLICQQCKMVTEYSSSPFFPELGAMMDKQKFKPQSTIIEVLGLCQSCV